ncbi:MAG: PASTA domain-containing protein [Alistipes sp.]|jgi:beta-lactam-binding protein with PASTA domain|nr:PASTA domain-containing protein [Alistipes sp.]
MSLLQKISRNIVARNLILAFCAVVVFAGVTALALNILTRHSQRKSVPDFIGVQISEVEQIARREGLRIEVIDSLYAPMYGGGAVIEQLPTGGTEVKKGRRIFVTITSHQQKMVPVPYVTGFSLRQAKNMIEMAGLEIAELRYVSNIATGNVLAELIGRDTVKRASNLQLEVGSGVTLIVGQSSDASWVPIPKLVGLSFGQAKSILWERGFNVGEVGRDDDINLINQKDAGVYRQSPAYGRQAALGTRVSIDLTLDEDKITEGNSAADRTARRTIQAQEAELEAARAAEADSLAQ